MGTERAEKFGAEKPGRLKKAMLHCPEQSIRQINETNHKFYLFDKVPDYDRYLEEHRSYRKLLEANGVEIFELSGLIAENRKLMNLLPNLAYLNDIAVITGQGAVLSSMCPGGRQYEELVVKEALTSLGIPILYECGVGDRFEGYIALSDNACFIADTERHSRESIERFFSFALERYTDVIYAEIPQARRFMHPDMIFGMVSEHLSLYYPAAFLKCWHITGNKRTKIDFKSWMKRRDIQLIGISDEEQRNWGTSFVLLEPGHMIHYDMALKPETRGMLEDAGVQMTLFHPDAILAGGGSLRCLTMRLLRE